MPTPVGQVSACQSTSTGVNGYIHVVSHSEFRLSGGRLCLDLIATLGRRHAEPVERIPDEATLADWLVAVDLLPPEPRPKVTSEQLGAYRELRERTHRLVHATMAGKKFGTEDITELNAVAARPDLAPQLVKPGAREVTWGDRNPVDAALATLARDAVTMLSGPRTDRIKECEHPDCSLLFFDDSQPGRRRWCSMDRCGNLVKIHAYRRRAPRLHDRIDGTGQQRTDLATGSSE